MRQVLLGIVYLLLGFGLIVATVATKTPMMLVAGGALILIGWVFLERARADRQARRDYQRLMNIIGRV